MSTGGPSAGSSNPSGRAALTRAETRVQVGAVTRYAAGEIACAVCQRMMGPEERFCAGCGQLRAGLDPEKVLPQLSRSEVAWREVQERLQAATLGRYEIVREIGRGGMAAVYLANEVTLKRQVAIKVMRPSFLLDEGMVERFGREARTMASLQHPNIVTIHAVEEIDQLHFFVMQFIPGLPLDHVIREHRQLPVAVMQAVMFQAAAALNHAHKQGVIHRDIKPANIMLDRDGNAIVTDFGIAKMTDVQATSATVGPMGTPLYMSPEQCSGAALTPASDQYALGNVAYEMLAGCPPFQRATAMALGAAIMAEKPKPVREFRTDCPPEIDAAIMRMLAKAPDDRFASLTDAVAALGGEALAEDDPVREYLRELVRRERKPDGRRLTPRASKTGLGRGRWTGGSGARFRRWLVIGLGGLGLASIGGYYLWNRPRKIPAVEAVVAASDSVAARPVPPAPPAARDSAPVPAPAPAPAPVPAAPAPAIDRAEISRLLAAARRSIASADWNGAADQLAKALAIDPRNNDTKILIGQVAEGRRADSIRAAAMVASAAQPAPLPPAPPPTRARVVDTVVKVVEPARPHHEAEIRAALDAYVRAINARSLTALKAVYPRMTARQERDWTDRFGDDVKSLAAGISIRSIDEAEQSAHAVFDLKLDLEPNGAAPITFRIRCDATLKNDGGWKIVSLTESGTG